MIKFMYSMVLMFALLLQAEGCAFEDLFGGTDTGESETVVDNSTYTYTYKCPVGSTNTVQIPNRLSAACKANWEYFARTYGCNDVDNFARANQLKAQCP